MYRGLRVAVVVPAFNEAGRIAATVRSIPRFADHVLVVDDASADATGRLAARSRRRGLEVLRHPRNRGVGAAIVSGYQRALELQVDAVAVMAGDGQMDPADLAALLDPVACGDCDYAKGNRFLHPDVGRAMPRARFVGNVALSWLTRATSGYWRLFDSQCGYTVISRRALAAVQLERVFPRYGYPNDLLARLNAAALRVRDVPVRPIYGAGWRSGIRPWTVVYPIGFVLCASLAWRLWTKLGRALRGAEHVLPARAR